ncbi:MAG: RnfABCDGE type electron transport complex subunit G [Lachnoclostridium sp.]|jgi:electron transport complex protein RnfG|nr:RnfABCDGE type electron transport complex subunit G [Lachnoclostridium sp.]
MKRKGDSFLRDALILFAITLIAGGVLAVVYNITQKPIQDAKTKVEEESYQAVLPEGKTFTDDAVLEQKRQSFKAEGTEIQKVKAANDDSGNICGFVFLVVAEEGYGGDIQFSMGVNADGSTGGIEIIQMNETAGLGAKCAEEDYKKQYRNKRGKITVVKGEAANANEISAISGATITSNAITAAVNEVLRFVEEIG